MIRRERYRGGMHELYIIIVEATALCFDPPPNNTTAHASPPTLALVYCSNG
jgi:hypothetical protein